MYYYQEHGIVLPSELEELFLAGAPDLLPPGPVLGGIADHPGYSVTVRNAESKLIGFLSAMDDGAVNACLTLVLVHPDFRRNGIATEMMRLAGEHYRSYYHLRLIASPDNAYFCQHRGFVVRSREIPMKRMNA